MSTRQHLGTWLVGVAMVAAACSGGSELADPDSSSLPTTNLDEPTAFALLVAEVEEDVVPLDTALQAFSLAIGELPGVAIPEGRRGLIPSGSGPVRWVLGHWDELTAEQQAAVERYIGSDPQEARGGPILAAAAPVPGAAAADVDEQAILGLIEQTLTKLAAKLGRPLGIPVELHVAPSFVDGDGAMFAVPVDANGGWSGTPVKCILKIGKLGISTAQQISGGVASAELEAFIAHELFHCYSHTVGVPGGQSRPAWVVEGMAEWAGETISGGSPIGQWAPWLTDPGVALFKRTYPAIGFWAHVDENSVGLWPVALDIQAASDAGSPAAYETALAWANEAMLTTWGPGYFRDPTHAPAWDQSGAGILSTKVVPLDLGDIGPGGGASPIAPPLGAAVYVMNFTAEVITVSSADLGMAQYPDGVVGTLPIAEVLCTDAAGCGCPDGSPGAGTIFRQTIAGQARVGLTGHLAGATLDVVGWALEDFCDEPPVPSCMIGEWLSEEYRAAGQAVIGGLATMSLTIDRTGRGDVEFNPEVPINARVENSGGIAPWVKMVFDGTFRFTITRNGTAGELVGGNGSLSYFAFLDGQWIPGPAPIELGTPGQVGSTFICQGDNLIVRAPGGVSEFEMSRIDS